MTGKTMHIRLFSEADQEAVLSLWATCGLIRPWNDPVKDIQRKLGFQPNTFLVGLVDDRIVGSLMAGYDGHRGWFNYLAVAPLYRQLGYGRLLVQYAENLLRQAGCPKVNVQIRCENRPVAAFYRSLNYETDDVLSLGKRLLQDD